MKKISLALAVLLTITIMMAGCSKKNVEETTSKPETTIEATTAETTTQTITEETTTTNTTETTEKSTEKEATTATTQATTTKPTTAKTETTKATTAKQEQTTASTEATTEKQPETTVETSNKTDLTALMAKIYGSLEEHPDVWNADITKENSSYYVGIENIDFVEGLASYAMMRVVPHSVCLLLLEEGTDIEAVKKEILEKINPRKWICAGVDREKVIVDSVGNIVIAIIDDKQPEKIHEAFLENAK